MNLATTHNSAYAYRHAAAVHGCARPYAGQWQHGVVVVSAVDGEGFDKLRSMLVTIGDPGSGG